jgi:hypothetical protein
MSDKNRGVYDKFMVARADGQSESGKKHYGCFYFVLDCDHDPHAMPALLTYADSCEAAGFKKLAEDLRNLVDERQTNTPADDEREPDTYCDDCGGIIGSDECQCADDAEQHIGTDHEKEAEPRPHFRADGIPSRCDLSIMSVVELQITAAIAAVEQLGANPALTQAVILLGQARDQVANHIEGDY